MEKRATMLRVAGVAAIGALGLFAQRASAEMGEGLPCNTCYEEPFCPGYALAQAACIQGCSQASEPIACLPSGHIDNSCGDYVEIACN